MFRKITIKICDNNKNYNILNCFYENIQKTFKFLSKTLIETDFTINKYIHIIKETMYLVQCCTNKTIVNMNQN